MLRLHKLQNSVEASPSPVYGAALLMRFGFIPIEGSNPSASATERNGKGSMRRVIAGLSAVGLMLGLAPAAAANPWAGVQAWETATVQRVVDGDTVIVRDAVTNQRSRIRLLGINSPEIDTAIKGGQCGGWQAKDALESLLPVGTQVRLLSADPSSKGRDDRPQRVVLAYNPLTNDFDLDMAWAMAERGWGIWYTVAREAAMSQLYRDVVAGAQQRGDGIWNPSLCGELEQPDAKVEMRISRAPGGKPNDEWVEVRNTGATDVDLTDWLLRDSGNQAWFRFPPGSILTPGEYRIVHTGSGTPGTPNPRDLYAGYTARIYPEPGRAPALLGDGAYLLDRYGNYRFWRQYPCTYECEQNPHDGAIVIEDLSLGKKRGKARAATQWVRFANRGVETVCLDGYRVVTGSTTYRIKPGTCLAPGTTWLLRVGRGRDTATVAHMNRTVPTLWASGSVRLITDREQTIVERFW